MNDSRVLARPADGSGAMFDGIAERYDLVNRIISFGIDRRWRRRTVRALQTSEPPQKVLDLATGTGDVALEIAAQYANARITGLDPSPRMLEIAQKKIEQKALGGRIDFVAGDAQALPFPDGAFDGVTIAFGIRNVPDRAKALAEMARVTRPGGRIAILELTEPRGLLAPLARFHVHTLVPTLGALLSGAREYHYLERSIARFPPAEEFVGLLEQVGIRPLLVQSLTFGVCHLFVGEPPASGARLPPHIGGA